MKKYTIQFELVSENKSLDTNQNINAICFTNRGTNSVYINGEPLDTNQSFSNNGHEGELDTTVYKIRFVEVALGTSLLHVRRKVYI